METIIVKVVREFVSNCHLYDSAGKNLDELWRQPPGVPFLCIDCGFAVELRSGPSKRGPLAPCSFIHWEIDSSQHFMSELLVREPMRVLLGTRKLVKVSAHALSCAEPAYAYAEDNGIVSLCIPLDKRRTVRVIWQSDVVPIIPKSRW